jgi:DNA-binding NtrC family response regulator
MMASYTVYIVDDEETVREGTGAYLTTSYNVKTFAAAEPALQEMMQRAPDLVLLDIGLPGMDGIEALRKMKGMWPDLQVVMITAYEDINTVVSAMKLGAYDYVVKPIHMDSLEVSIQNALETVKLRKEVQLLQERYLRENIPCFIGESDAIQDVMEFIGMVAKSPDTPILIMGETGTGKELIASAIHCRSPNFKGQLVTVNCAAIPRDLIESELFGYEKGAFSGAISSGKRGLIEDARGGTLFLDEVGDLSLDAQAKLLRFLELGTFYRVGGVEELHVKTRLVSATNKDIERMVEEGTFRKDLFFRLGVVKVHVPSLNERKEDIIPLAKYFLYEFSRKFNKDIHGISPSAKEALMSHSWVGHVRELRNLVERATLVGKGPDLEVEDLGIVGGESAFSLRKAGGETELTPLSSSGVDLTSIEESIERHYIEEALRMAKGNESRAARLLNINHHTFRYRKKKLQIR